MQLKKQLHQFGPKWMCAVICLTVNLLSVNAHGQTILLNGRAGGKRFDGVGAVSGGGATTVLLKDYPEVQRNQVLDLLFKPNFGASMNALLVEVPGDGNSTQGAEPSHMHTKDDLNYDRGYEWWLMSEAKKRNKEITLDANGWGCPGWVGNGVFWSQDMCDYYVKWIQGLKSTYGLTLDAIGCRNEKGVSKDFVKKFRKTLVASGLENVKIHAFDNWGKNKFDWVKDLETDAELRNAVAIIGNHTMSEIETPEDVKKLSDRLNIPIWNTEEHTYKEGFDCEISLVKSFNENFIISGVTKIVNWYLVGSVYPAEPYAESPATMIANSPWSGFYRTREALWGYAHYGQFAKIGWQYLNGASGKLDKGGTYVTLRSPGKDYSVIFESKDAKASQTITFKISGRLSAGKLCVWRSNEKEQFVRLADIIPKNNTYTITVDPQSIYSISTTSGQQKGSFAQIPEENKFPFPYYETFDEYSSPRQFGYLPHYTADISSIFEIASRPDKSGQCLRQVIAAPPQSWAPEWMPYTIVGDDGWQDYEVSADIYMDNGGAAGVMGRINNVGGGYGCVPKGYYFNVGADGTCSLFISTQKKNEDIGDKLAGATIPNFLADKWHNVKLQFSGDTISGFLDNVKILSAKNNVYPKGMAGLMTGTVPKLRNTAFFDNLLINTVNGTLPKPVLFENISPIYKK
ncbi:MAG: galactosylceramidase [Bacteroidota bacterium]